MVVEAAAVQEIDKKMKKLIKLSVDLYYGSIDGLFFASDDELEKIKNHTFYLGDELGKHSDVVLKDFEEDELMILPLPEELLEQLYKFDPNFSVGYNLVNYLE